mmetsp:Transcript_54749/g.123273  ORF Transcript_54749/g.123273 Transcript_54749/m.123273 type:complete len:300 (+) Transcript_54749:1048-1947(+)
MTATASATSSRPRAPQRTASTLLGARPATCSWRSEWSRRSSRARPTRSGTGCTSPAQRRRPTGRPASRTAWFGSGRARTWPSTRRRSRRSSRRIAWRISVALASTQWTFGGRQSWRTPPGSTTSCRRSWTGTTLLTSSTRTSTGGLRSWSARRPCSSKRRRCAMMTRSSPRPARLCGFWSRPTAGLRRRSSQAGWRSQGMDALSSGRRATKWRTWSRNSRARASTHPRCGAGPSRARGPSSLSWASGSARRARARRACGRAPSLARGRHQLLLPAARAACVACRPRRPPRKRRKSAERG